MPIELLDILKSLFCPSYEVFGKKSKKIQVGKTRMYDEEVEVFFGQKKRFHLFKSLLYQNMNAQNMPVVAGHLVQLIFT